MATTLLQQFIKKKRVNTPSVRTTPWKVSLKKLLRVEDELLSFPSIVQNKGFNIEANNEYR